MHLLLLLAACSDKPYVYDTGDLVDTGVPQCGRIRGTEGVLMYQEEARTIRTPLDSPNGFETTTGVAGPLGDDRTYVAVVSGTVILSEDGGCNWDSVGSLASGDWRLVSAGERVYAFDASSSAGARSDDFGTNWTVFDAGEPFFGTPVVDAADSARLRGLQARGVVTSSDGGDTWEAGAALPAEETSFTDGDVFAENVDVAVVGGATGAWRTEDAGENWSAVLAETAVSAVAIHPDDPAVLFAIGTDTDGVTTISRTGDAGGDWARLVDSAQIEIDTTSDLWPVPGDPLTVLATFGPVYNENTDSNGVNLYIATGGTGTRTAYVGTWYRIHQLAFGGDRWLAAVDAVEAR